MDGSKNLVRIRLSSRPSPHRREARHAASSIDRLRVCAAPRSAGVGACSGLNRRRCPRHVGRGAAGRHRRDHESVVDREEPVGRHRRHGTVQDRRPAPRHLCGDIYAVGVQHRPPGGHRAQRIVCRNGERRAEDRLHRGNDHGDERVADCRPPKRRQAARPRTRSLERHSHGTHAADDGDSDSGDEHQQSGCGWNEHHQYHGREHHHPWEQRQRPTHHDRRFVHGKRRAGRPGEQLLAQHG